MMYGITNIPLMGKIKIFNTSQNNNQGLIEYVSFLTQSKCFILIVTLFKYKAIDRII